MSTQQTDRTRATSHRWSMKDLVLIVVLGAVFGFAYWALVQGWSALRVAMGPAGDLSEHVLSGGWVLVAPIAIAITRRPGAGILAELIAATMEFAFLGSPVGPLLLVGAFIQGLGCELAFALTRYKNFGWWVFALSGLLGTGIVFFYSAFRGGWYGQDIFALRLSIQLLSGIVLGGLFAKVIVDTLARTGVVDNFAIGRDLRP